MSGISPIGATRGEFLLTGECPAGGVKGRYRKTIPCREVLSQQGQGTSNLSGTDDGGYNGSSRERNVRDGQEREVIPQTIQLIAGRTGQEYNQRKNRKGAFWEDRYHATAVEAGPHLVQCMVYIDLNMVRAGVVTHPSKWPFCGYNEIQNPRERYALIDHESVIAYSAEFGHLFRWKAATCSD